MTRSRVVLAVIGLALVLVATPSPVAAQEPPPSSPVEPIPAGCQDGPPGPAYPGTQCPDGSIPVPAGGPPGCQFGPSAPPTAGTVCPDGSAPRDRIADRRLRNILGLDEAGEPYPLESYDIGCDEGSWNAFLRKLWCGAQAMPFAFGKWAIGLGTDLMGWALEFRLATSLTPVAGLLSQVYDTSLIGPLGVRDLAWTLAMFVAGWHLLRGRGARGASETAATFLIACLGSIVLANPQGYLEGSITLAQNSSGAVLEAIDDTLQPTSPSGDAEGVRDRLSDILRRSFVAEPYDLLNWGESLSGPCATARDEILARGPWGSDDEPRTVMRAAGCDEQADWNNDPSDSRAAGSLIVMLASIATTVLLVAIALVVFLAQLTLVAMFAGASLFWALALFPGVGRQLLWWWLSRLAWAVMATIGATFVLSWLAVTVTAALNATTDFSIIQRCLVALLIVGFAFRLRSQIGHNVEALSRHFGDRVAQSVGQPSRAPAVAAGAVAGFGLSAMARSWAMDTPGGQYAYNRLYARHFTRGYRGRGHALGGVRRALGRANSIDRGVTGAGRNAAQTFGRGVRAVAMAPVLGPQAVAASRTRATATSARARARLDQARATRQQWRRNVAHPVEAVRVASGTPRPARPGRTPAATPPRASSPPVGSWWRVAGTPYTQPGLEFDRDPVGYEQLRFVLPHGARPQPRPAWTRPTPTYDQQSLGLGRSQLHQQQRFDYLPPQRERPVTADEPTTEQLRLSLAQQQRLDLGGSDSHQQQRFDYPAPHDKRPVTADEPTTEQLLLTLAEQQRLDMNTPPSPDPAPVEHPTAAPAAADEQQRLPLTEQLRLPATPPSGTDDGSDP